MIPSKTLFLVIMATLGLSACKKEHSPTDRITSQEMWYDHPADNWMQALPVGNGRLGAMVFGHPTSERIQLNEDSMWAGAADWGDAKGTPEDLAEIRQLLREGKTQQVDSLMVERFSYKSVLRSHQTMGDLYLNFEPGDSIQEYRRSLSLDEAVVVSTFLKNGHRYMQKVFATAPDDVLVVQLVTEDPKGLRVQVHMDRPEDHGHKTVTVTNPSDNEISMEGMATQYGGKRFSQPLPMDYGVRFETLLKAVTDGGQVRAHNGQLIIEGGAMVTLYLSGKTSFYHDDFKAENQKVIANAIKKGIESIWEEHKTDHQEYYHRVDLDLEGQALDSLPTDQRLARLRDNPDMRDTDLAATLFQYGRYLLISSSRPGTNPANLQGIWNQHIEAPWNADYHVNINLQMNYWPANVTQLDELNRPLFHFMDRVLERGKNTAKQQYGMQGAIIHHTTDLWATPWMRAATAYWGSWIHGGGWMGQHYWEQYRFTQDKTFLRERVYPYLREIAAFYTDWLVWDGEKGYYISTPDTSPEN
ncbi:MAG: glycoside hydrolase N-terminal domain-containing protein, partial [Flavobacteriaceae bacterium]